MGNEELQVFTTAGPSMFHRDKCRAKRLQDKRGHFEAFLTIGFSPDPGISEPLEVHLSLFWIYPLSSQPGTTGMIYGEGHNSLV